MEPPTQPKKRGRPSKKQDESIPKVEAEPKKEFDFSTLSSSTCEKLLSIAKTAFPTQSTITDHQVFAPTSPTYSPPRSPPRSPTENHHSFGFPPTSPTENYPQSPVQKQFTVSSIPPPSFSDFASGPTSGPTSVGRGHYIHPDRQGFHGNMSQSQYQPPPQNQSQFQQPQNQSQYQQPQSQYQQPQNQSQPQYQPQNQYPQRGRGSFQPHDRGIQGRGQTPYQTTYSNQQSNSQQFQQSNSQQYSKPRNIFSDTSNTKIIALERQIASLQNDVISTRGEMESMKFRLMAAEKKIQAMMEK